MHCQFNMFFGMEDIKLTLLLDLNTVVNITAVIKAYSSTSIVSL